MSVIVPINRLYRLLGIIAEPMEALSFGQPIGHELVHQGKRYAPRRFLAFCRDHQEPLALPNYRTYPYFYS
jgi:hypothetical protein